MGENKGKGEKTVSGTLKLTYLRKEEMSNALAANAKMELTRSYLGRETASQRKTRLVKNINEWIYILSSLSIKGLRFHKHQQWWTQSCARGRVGHGQEFVETIMSVRSSAFDLKEHVMDLAIMSSLLTSASATSHVN
ncbi:hypothetical protein YC2023_078689 [Brassica napus]